MQVPNWITCRHPGDIFYYFIEYRAITISMGEGWKTHSIVLHSNDVYFYLFKLLHEFTCADNDSVLIIANKNDSHVYLTKKWKMYIYFTGSAHNYISTLKNAIFEIPAPAISSTAYSKR